MGDALMAFFGAPVEHEDDPSRALETALDMLEAISVMNVERESRAAPPFSIGIGINFGPVTVGNIGSDRKMDYTVVGDMVNMAFRLQQLTKVYGVPLVVADSVRVAVDAALPFRLLDRVSLGKENDAISIYDVRRVVPEATAELWRLHEEATALYYARDFAAAGKLFQIAQELAASDTVTATFLARRRLHQVAPVSDDWTGVVELETAVR